ncbi:hypothetical protein FNH22_29140 [Fulvivirga sp. M361]|uniref:hypothetical protein n=1 Tax=Fulvivirga sp. M361 TaxID=2594266 RepID=UPI00117AF7A8|nr:hypothetical protein [Fulvivirga sp. M361]TRX48384.1 hypothetical protein FNH22_29140 [Fulvivirga sp. M361]
MKNWNKIGYGKAIFLAIFAVINFLDPIYYTLTDVLLKFLSTVGAVIGWAIFGTIITVLIVKVFGGTLTKPNWNDNPFKLREPMVLMQFISIGVIIFGCSNSLSVFLNHGDISLYGLQNILGGIGIMISMKLSERILKGTH